MSNKLSWRDALKQFNDDRIKEGGKYSIPKKGTPEYASVKRLQGEDIDAVELKPNQTVTGQDPPAPLKQSRAKSRTPPKQKPDDNPTKADEPKPVPKVADEAPVTAGLKNKKSKKKSVATQTSAPEPSSPQSEDFIVKLK